MTKFNITIELDEDIVILSAKEKGWTEDVQVPNMVDETTTQLDPENEGKTIEVPTGNKLERGTKSEKNPVTPTEYLKNYVEELLTNEFISIAQSIANKKAQAQSEVVIAEEVEKAKVLAKSAISITTK